MTKLNINPDQPDCLVWRSLTITGTGKVDPDSGKKLFKFSNSVLGKKRLTNPENGKPIVMTGDLKLSKPKDSDVWTFKLFFKGEWHIVPSEAEFRRWTFDSVCESPDGSIVEPDAPESWLSLMALI